jgi:carbamoyl-phosphate synthase large subunit
MARIQIGGAGGAPANNFIRALRESTREDYLIGTSSVASDLFLADTDERHVVPPAKDDHYRTVLLDLLQRAKPDLLYVTHDYEVLAVSRLRDEILSLGVKLFLPSPQTVEATVDKYRSYLIWRKAGLTVPETILINTPRDLDDAFENLGPRVWLRATTGGGGRGALPTNSREMARQWVERMDGWGSFTAARCLTTRSVTWQSIWYEGDLIVAQGRRRHAWSFADRTVSGVTGITRVAETCSDAEVDRVAEAAIRSSDPRPHGIFGVDLTYDDDGRPNPTEINIGRFFTTILFFARAGLNLPQIYCDLALHGQRPDLKRKLNPLPEGLLWIRGMDVEPVLTTDQKMKELARQVTWAH